MNQKYISIGDTLKNFSKLSKTAPLKSKFRPLYVRNLPLNFQIERVILLFAGRRWGVLTIAPLNRGLWPFLSFVIQDKVSVTILLVIFAEFNVKDFFLRHYFGILF